MKKQYWNSVFEMEVMMDFFIVWCHFIVNVRREGMDCSVDVFCVVASLEGMSESFSIGHCVWEGV